MITSRDRSNAALAVPRKRARTLVPLLAVLAMLATLMAPAYAGDVPPTGVLDNESTPVEPPYDPLDPIIDNGTNVQMGVRPAGDLNSPGGTASMPSASTTVVGLRYMPTNGEATAPGCTCEGWGVANADGATGTFAGYANSAVDGVVNLAVQPATGIYPGPVGETKLKAESVGTRFRSVTISSSRVKVTQDYHPTPLTPNLYQVDVTMENIGATPIGDLRYRRVMDWDIAPFTFSEYSEIHVGTSANLVRATTDGFRSGNPLSSPGPLAGSPPTTLTSGSTDYLSGPSDQGALFDFKFGSLPAGETKQFRIFYGAAGNRADALSSLVAVGAEMYSLGMPRQSSGAVSTTGPHAFAFGFSGVGGAPVGDVALTPATATNPVGTSHTVDATVTEDGVVQVGKTVTFTVLSGPHAGTTGTAVTDAAGKASFSYSGTSPGTDVIEASFVDSAGTIQRSNRATKEWIAVANQPPTGGAGGPYTGSEGAAIAVDGTAADDDGDPLTYSWAQAAGGSFDSGAACTFGDTTALDTTVTCTDDGTFNLELTINDGVNPPVTTSTTATVGNVNPTIDITAPADGTVVAMGTLVNVASTFGDVGTNDLGAMTCSVNWDIPTVPAATVAPSGTSCNAGNTYTAAGVYNITVTANDQDGGTATDTVMVVVYDPSAGFVTGGGWINSPAGAYVADPTLVGKANFGFVSKYKKGTTVPTGQTEFQFHAGSFKFHSATYQWLVVSGPKAQYKGTGTVNGAPGYSFLLTATDGQVSGGGGVDKFRIKVWDTASGEVVYDNVAAAPDTLAGADPQAIGGGSIVIHK